MDYFTIKIIHQTAAYLSICLFIYRWVLSFDNHDWKNQRWLKIVPHANDTLLLTMGVTMAFMAKITPFVSAPWLSVKIVFLMLYIALGFVALKTQDKKHRFWFGIAALLTFGYVTAIATTKMILPPFIY